MAKYKIARLKDMKDKAWRESDDNRALFEDCYEYLMPYRNIYSNTSKTHNKNTKQYDSTGMIAGNNFVNTMQSRFTPVFQKWAELKSGPEIPENQREKNDKALSKVSEKIQAYRNASNFYTATAEMYFDLGIGTGVMFILEGDDERPMNYVCAPISTIALGEGKHGEVSNIWRRHKMKGSMIKPTWPKAKIGAQLTQQIQDKPEEEVQIEEGFYYDYDEFMWYQCVFWCGSQAQGDEVLFEDEFVEAPFVAPRWMKIPGFATGIGPFIMAMADYKTLNKMKELMLMLAAINVFGVYTVASGGTFNVNTAQIKPAAFIPVERNGTQNPSIAALPRAGSFEIQEYMLNDLKDQIRKIMLDSGIPNEEDPVRTAYEIAERIKKMQLDIGAAFGRLVYEFALPLHRREVAILQKKGLIEVPKDFRIDNFYTKVQVVSPIAQAQAAEDVQRAIQAYSLTAGISEELAMLTYDIEAMGTWIGRNLSVAPELLRDETTKQQLQESVAKIIANVQMQAAAQQQQQQQQKAKA